MFLQLIRAMRPKQWIKNALICAPLIFSLQLFNLTTVLHTFIGIISFCALSSAMYVVNDLYDLPKDKLHPVKRFRPLAAGLLSVRFSVVAIAVLLIMGFSFAAWVGISFLAVAFSYVLLVLAYSKWLKQIVIVDMLTVSAGFVLRAMAGVESIHVAISPWLLVTTFFTAIFIIAGKRRHELVLLGDGAASHRSILEMYSESFLDQLIQAGVAGALMSYTVYTLSSETVTRYGFTSMVYTIPVVTYGLFRYVYLIYRKEEGGDPTDSLLSDLPLLLSIVIWGVLVVAIIYA